MLSMHRWLTSQLGNCILWKMFTCLHLVLLCTEAVLCCKAKCDEGRFLVRHVQVHKRPKLKQHGRVVHASTLGVYFKSPQLSTASGMVKNEAFIVLLVGWCAICLNAVKMARSIVEKENGKTLKHCCSKSSLHAFGLSIIGHAWIPWFAQGFSKETNHCKNISANCLSIALLNFCNTRKT